MLCFVLIGQSEQWVTRTISVMLHIYFLRFKARELWWQISFLYWSWTFLLCRKHEVYCWNWTYFSNIQIFLGLSVQDQSVCSVCSPKVKWIWRFFIRFFSIIAYNPTNKDSAPFSDSSFHDAFSTWRKMARSIKANIPSITF